MDTRHTPTQHNGRTVCTCGDFNCASLDVRWVAQDDTERAMLGHVRGWCHNGATCPLCKAQDRAFRAERELDRIIEG